MSRREPKPLSASGADVTVDGQLNGSLPSADTPAPRIALVEGRTTGVTSQTNSLLRVRLRAASLVLFGGSLAFFLNGLLRPHGTVEDGRGILFWMHLTHVVVLGTVAFGLCTRVQLSSFWLRVDEVTMFGLTAVLFAMVQHHSTLIAARQARPPNLPIEFWFALMFTYAIFIPTTWRRAAVVLAMIAAAPLASLLVDRAMYQDVAAVATSDLLIYLTLTMSVGFAASFLGTRMINNLRREVFEARQLGQYRLRSLIGAGGMGEVYLAEHQLLKRPCALKVIRPSKSHDPKALARFEREVCATAALTHWNTVEVYDYGSTDDGTFYYVMEYLPGLSLGDLVDRYGPLPAERVIYLLTQTCDALREAHSLGLVHRDIKPGNIFAANRGGVYDVAKLLDFGLTTPLADMPSVHLTQEGAVTGSPLYMSPEQALGDSEPDARSDIYSIGAVAYFALTGRPPFEGERPMKVLLAHVHDDVLPPSRLNSDTPDDLERIVMRCLSKRPEDRFQTAADLGQALSRCDASGEWTRHRAAEWWSQAGGPTTVAVT